jgi:uncharacterized protein
MNVEEALHGQRERILQIAAKYGAGNVRVFGSVARGEATEHSDLDLLVEFEPHRSLLDHSGLKIDLEEALCRKVDVVTPDAIHWYIKDRILAEAVPL